MSSADVRVGSGQADSRREFMARIKEIWVARGRPADSWDCIHDWDGYYRLGYRAETAHEAVNDAMRCE